jgi:hypothetical protein
VSTAIPLCSTAISTDASGEPELPRFRSGRTRCVAVTVAVAVVAAAVGALAGVRAASKPMRRDAEKLTTGAGIARETALTRRPGFAL